MIKKLSNRDLHDVNGGTIIKITSLIDGRLVTKYTVVGELEKNKSNYETQNYYPTYDTLEEALDYAKFVGVSTDIQDRDKIIPGRVLYEAGPAVPFPNVITSNVAPLQVPIPTVPRSPR